MKFRWDLEWFSWKKKGRGELMPCTNYHFFFFFFYHFSLFFIGRIWLICVQNQVPQEYLLFFFFFLAKQAVPIDLKPTHCFWAQILILSSACASCNTFEHEFWAKCKISNFKIEYLWRCLKYHSYLICTLKWSDQYCN